MKLPVEQEIKLIEIITDDYGTAKKYSDGTMVVTQRYNVTVYGNSNSWGNIYTFYGETLKPYPTSFAEIPTVTCHIEAIEGNFWVITKNGEQDGTVDHPQDIQYGRGTTWNSDTAVIINIIAIGKWK